MSGQPLVYVVPRWGGTPSSDLHVPLSKDDPSTCDQEANARRWRERLGAGVTLLEARRQFHDVEEPVALAALGEWLRAGER